MNDPPLTEIWSGEALNSLLRNAQQMAARKVVGPNVPLDEETISKININSGRAGVNFGIIKNEGKLTFPVALRALTPEKESKDLRDYLQNLTQDAFSKAKERGEVDGGTIRELERTVAGLEKMLLKNVGDMPFSDYSEGKRYINQLNDGIKALREPNIGDFAAGKMKLKGNTVGDLVDYMTRNGLQFAPAVPGEENAYVALHRWLVTFNAPGANLAAER
jgi:hypothetical protein